MPALIHSVVDSVAFHQRLAPQGIELKTLQSRERLHSDIDIMLSSLCFKSRLVTAAPLLHLTLLRRTLSTNAVETPSILRRLYDQYSIKGQQKRIDMGERLFRAAYIRANDP